MPLVRECINLQNRAWVAPNVWNQCLESQGELWDTIIARGGLETTCVGQKKKRYERPPWEVKPPEGEDIREFGSIVLPVDDGVDNLVLEFRMPVGWDGVSQHVSCTYTGSGFDQGSGDITWRLKVGSRFMPGYQAITSQLNDLQFPYSNVGGYIRLLSLQYVRIYAAIAIGAASRLTGGRVNAAIAGWKYPKR